MKSVKFLNSKHIKIVAITHKVKKIYIDNYLVNEDKIVVLASGSGLKKNFVLKTIKKNLKLGILEL